MTGSGGERLLVALLGGPVTCRHGNPIPGARGMANSAPTVRLAAAQPVLGTDAATLAEGFRYLAALRLELALDPARRADSESGHRIHLAALNALERRFLKDIFTLLRDVRDGLVARFSL